MLKFSCNQNLYRNSREIWIDRIPSESRRFLVMIRAGPQPRSLFFSKPLPEHRIFDLAMNYYGVPNPDDIAFGTADIVLGGGLSKFHGAKVFLEATGFHGRYDGIMFLDEDVDLLFEPGRFLTFCVKNNLDLAQPSVSNAEDSFATWRITRHHPGLSMRETNFVEVMAPYFSQHFLAAMLHSFDLCLSTWGLDIYWGAHLGTKWRAGIVDDFQMKHGKPVNKSGEFYRYLKSIGVDPIEDKQKVLRAIGRQQYDIHPIRFVYWHEYVTGQS